MGHTLGHTLVLNATLSISTLPMREYVSTIEGRSSMLTLPLICPLVCCTSWLNAGIKYQ